MLEAINNCKMLLGNGYEIYLQPAVINEYDINDLKALARFANELSVNGVYIVDTYGVLTPKETRYYYNILNKDLNDNIVIGLHIHNNLQLSLANVNAIVEMEPPRTIYIDSCVLGIGRGAGNLCTEVSLHIYNESNYYNIYPLLEIIDEVISEIKVKRDWGYSVEYFLTAFHKIHPNYTQ